MKFFISWVSNFDSTKKDRQNFENDRTPCTKIFLIYLYVRKAFLNPFKIVYAFDAFEIFFKHNYIGNTLQM